LLTRTLLYVIPSGTVTFACVALWAWSFWLSVREANERTQNLGRTLRFLLAVFGLLFLIIVPVGLFHPYMR